MSVDPEDVADAGVTGQLALLRAGRLTAVELLELCLARTARLTAGSTPLPARPPRRRPT